MPGAGGLFHPLPPGAGDHQVCAVSVGEGPSQQVAGPGPSELAGPRLCDQSAGPASAPGREGRSLLEPFSLPERGGTCILARKVTVALPVAQETLVLPWEAHHTHFQIHTPYLVSRPWMPGTRASPWSLRRPVPREASMRLLAAGARVTAAIAVLSDGLGKDSPAWRQGTGPDDPQPSCRSIRHPLSPARAPGPVCV